MQMGRTGDPKGKGKELMKRATIVFAVVAALLALTAGTALAVTKYGTNGSLK